MRNRNTMSRRDFLWDHVYWGMLVMMMYRNTLFQTAFDLTLSQSRFLLWALATVSILLGMAITCNHRRNSLSVAVNVLFPFEIYALLSCRNFMGAGAIWGCAIAAALSVAYFLAVMALCGADRKHRYPFLATLRHSLLGARTVLVFSFALFWLPVIVSVLLGNPLFQSTVAPAAEERVVWEEDGELARAFEPENWQELSLQERLDTLQTLANEEATRLGLPTGLAVGADLLPENTGGYYQHGQRRIVVNLTFLREAASWEMVDTVCHEVYHAYQHTLCELWESTEEEYRSLACFGYAEEFYREFADYVDAEEDLQGYYDMTCEQTARRYAQERQLVYRAVAAESNP